MPYVVVSALSHDGVVRDHNEDSLVLGPWTLCAASTDSPQSMVFPLGDTPVVVAVADGLGGHPAGDVASALTARHLAAAGPRLRTEREVTDELRACHAVLHAAADADPGLAGMATTVAGAAFGADHVLVFNVGDSQVYAITPDRGDGLGLRLLSTDDSPPPAPGRRTSHLVTSTLGGPTAPEDLHPHLVRLPVEPGARYLLCTDGLTDPVAPEDLAALLTEAEAEADGDPQGDDQRALVDLWRAAIRAGGPDNVTLALVRIED
ncbi:serine/threonine-protein phosphatase [Kitasatospora sp. NA04385]|uniref:PP2C family protein-serine/threonine phosphatase n=1 Tax=Kitasatospora sp. NA04385 TaxID=2742135 RepID=UPI00158FDE45|nr:protein phosphatase 2C domain-containing protein [Kitasatospora sp. NA04385]QKW17947.1 serine/threonine-protein phosphatase [Kitasatospora sp. NA04385]